MDARRPIVRHFIACDEVEETHTSEGRQYTLKRIVHRIRLRAGAAFPRVHPSLSFFVMLTDGPGVHAFNMEVVYWQHGEQESLWRTKTATRDLGADPLAVHGWPIRLRNIMLRQPGEYEFVLWCDDVILARETINVEEAP